MASTLSQWVGRPDGFSVAAPSFRSRGCWRARDKGHRPSWSGRALFVPPPLLCGVCGGRTMGTRRGTGRPRSSSQPPADHLSCRPEPGADWLGTFPTEPGPWSQGQALLSLRAPSVSPGVPFTALSPPSPLLPDHMDCCSSSSSV